MTQSIGLWAHVDGDGRIVTHGACATSDLNLQPTPDGLHFVERPDYVTAFEPWRLVNGEWIKEAT